MKIVIDGKTAEIPGGGSSGSTGIPAGLIAIWSGASDAVPEGWRLCDGTNGTPDLRDKFVLGAGSSYAVGTSGGEGNVILTVDQIPSHNHQVTIGAVGSVWGNEIGTGRSYTVRTIHNTVYTTSTGRTQPHNNMPPYYALCYIMKIN